MNLTLIRYSIVGMTGMVTDFSTTWFFKEKVKVNPFVANSIGFIVAVTSNFILNRYWTFQTHYGPASIQFIKFISVSLFGLLINNILLYLLTKKSDFNFYISKLFIVAAVFFWNYFMNVFFTFK
jgi:putative flippase GtrA